MSPEFTLFLDENHHRNKALLHVLTDTGVSFERHEQHFAAGTPDEVWLAEIGAKGWFLLTSDTRIRHRHSERAQVLRHRIGLFCFSSNNQPAAEMAVSLRAALSEMERLSRELLPPFIATIDKAGRVTPRPFE